MPVLLVSLQYVGATSQCTSSCWCYWSVYIILVLQPQWTSWCWCHWSLYVLMMLQVSVVDHDAGATGKCTVCWCYRTVYLMMLVLQVSVPHDAGATGQCTSWCWCYRSVYLMMLVLLVSVPHDAGATGQCKVCWCYIQVSVPHDAGATVQCTSWCWCCRSVYLMMLVLLVIVPYAGAPGQCTMYIMMPVLLVSVHHDAGATSKCTSWCQCYRSVHRVHRVVTAAFWRTFHHEGNISPGWWGWGVHAHLLSLHLPSPVKLQCTLQLSAL